MRLKNSVFAPPVTRRHFLVWTGGALAGVRFYPALAAGPADVAPQPYFASVIRAVAALAAAGQPIAQSDADRLATLAAKSDAEAVATAEAILDQYTLARVSLDTDGLGTVVKGGAKRLLVEQGWRLFLIRVANPHRLTKTLSIQTETLLANLPTLPKTVKDTEQVLQIQQKWLDAQMRPDQSLSGFEVEYQVAEIFSRDRGERSAILSWGAGKPRWWGVQYWDQAVFSSVFLANQSFDFTVLPSKDVMIGVRDEDGKGCIASLIIRDGQSHVYPAQTMRIAPDMQFHPQVYRADGETARLPDGDYVIESWRGPEYLRAKQKVRIAEGDRRIDVGLQRWIDPRRWGWYSGDTHVHAAGCAHYTSPTEGISPESVIRQVRGEGLSLAEVLNWAPGWAYQRQFFSDHVESPEATLEHSDLQAADNASLKPKPTLKDTESQIRYDVEISGFPSSHSGHLVLLGLKDCNYPGTQSPDEWPSWHLPILKWAKVQGGIAGFAHSGHGQQSVSDRLPNYDIPLFNGVGAHESIIDITHDACDFLSACDSGTAVTELNAWYHMLNSGFRIAMLGETDYPCMFDERPGVGRSYIQLDRPPAGDSGYRAWIDGIKTGRLYFGDGRSHFLKCQIGGKALGSGDVILTASEWIAVEALVAARLEPMPGSDPPSFRETWHVERARLGETRNVPVELVVNGNVVERAELLADGKPRPIRFKTRIERSSWVALRILPSGHTHPIFVMVGGKPIRASRRSAEWLRKCVDALWEEKYRLIRESERPAAAEAYNHARQTYDHIITESDRA